MTNVKLTDDQWTKMLAFLKQDPNAYVANEADCRRFVEAAMWINRSGRGDWLSGPCLYPTHHRHDDTHPSFGFNIRSGYGNCYVCGSILLKDICTELGIHPADYGGLFV